MKLHIRSGCFFLNVYCLALSLKVLGQRDLASSNVVRSRFVAMGLALVILFFLTSLEAVEVNKGHRFTQKEVDAWLQSKLSKSSAVLFRSREGVAYQMDSDTDMIFLEGNAVVMHEFGYGLATYRGSYEITAQGVLQFKFEKYEFPDVYFYREGEYVRMAPTQGVGFQMGHRGGAFESSDMKPFWPFQYVQ